MEDEFSKRLDRAYIRQSKEAIEDVKKELMHNLALAVNKAASAITESKYLDRYRSKHCEYEDCGAIKKDLLEIIKKVVPDFDKALLLDVFIEDGKIGMSFDINKDFFE